MVRIAGRKRRILTHPALIALTSILVFLVVRILMATIRKRFVLDDPAWRPGNMDRKGLYIFWHEMLLFPAYTHSRQFAALISQSQDGELAARAVRLFGGQVIRGSASRGRLAAFRELCRQVEFCDVGIAADGPRGPARVVPAGVVRAAEATGKPIIPVGLAFSRAVCVGPRGRKMAIPWPFASAWMVMGRPIVVPTSKRQDRQANIQLVQAAMNDVHDRAARLAAGAECPSEPMDLAQSRALWAT